MYTPTVQLLCPANHRTQPAFQWLKSTNPALALNQSWTVTRPSPLKSWRKEDENGAKTAQEHKLFRERKSPLPISGFSL
ncbi:hypothetical protein BaRGS_00037462 [Batillaria attramentaria]|uniref:Ig-like domain-containing protein n=1 Tax=Batillaria attramentaria TaxID=370345 RepID=A0ABD0J9V2_9CAEN